MAAGRASTSPQSRCLASPDHQHPPLLPSPLPLAPHSSSPSSSPPSSFAAPPPLTPDTPRVQVPASWRGAFPPAVQTTHRAAGGGGARHAVRVVFAPLADVLVVAPEDVRCAQSGAALVPCVLAAADALAPPGGAFGDPDDPGGAVRLEPGAAAWVAAHSDLARCGSYWWNRHLLNPHKMQVRPVRPLRPAPLALHCETAVLLCCCAAVLLCCCVTVLRRARRGAGRARAGGCRGRAREPARRRGDLRADRRRRLRSPLASPELTDW